MLRWFTPNSEVDLCGHATLATAYYIFNIAEKDRSEDITFHSKSGILKVKKDNNILTLDFPSDSIEEIKNFDNITEGFNIKPEKVYKGVSDYMLIYNKESDIADLNPDFNKLNEIDTRGFIVTAVGDNVDFVSRFFAPNCAIDEDPVTGSAHTTLTPYWSKVLDKTELSALQISPRAGKLFCKYLGDRVEISGSARLYLKGEIDI